MRALIRPTLCLLLALACSGPPGGEARFEWTAAVADLDEAILAACAGDRVIAVGGERGRGLILEWTGAVWRAPALPEGTPVLWWCWADAGGAAFAVGERGVVLERRGERWVRLDAGDAVPAHHTLYGVWHTGAELVVVGGSLSDPSAPATLARYDGQLWQRLAGDELPAQPLFKVWGAGPTDLWAVGGGGTILRGDGERWTAAASPVTVDLIAVWGAGPDEVYAVGGTPGAGVLLRWEGGAWALVDTTPERLSGVWTAPDRPLYVGGDRGFVARYARSPAAGAVPEGAVSTSVTNALCIHGLAGTSEQVIAAAADLLGPSSASRRGGLLTHGRALVGPVEREEAVDAGPPADGGDAGGVPLDGGGGDAGGDGDGGGGALPGPGEACGQGPDFCRPELECWLILPAGDYVCTEPCGSAAECVEYGVGACCERPGFQTLETTCIPAPYEQCSSQP